MNHALVPSVLLVLGAALGAGLGRPQEEPKTELAGHMEAIEDALKLLRKSLREPEGAAAALEALTVLQRESIASKALVPALAAPLPDRERTTLVKDYRRAMVDFVSLQLDLEAALLDGDAETAQALFDQLRQTEDSAHERFAPEDD